MNSGWNELEGKSKCLGRKTEDKYNQPICRNTMTEGHRWGIQENPISLCLWCHYYSEIFCFQFSKLFFLDIHCPGTWYTKQYIIWRNTRGFIKAFVLFLLKFNMFFVNSKKVKDVCMFARAGVYTQKMFHTM